MKGIAPKGTTMAEIVSASFPFMLMNVAMMTTIMIFRDTALWLVRTMRQKGSCISHPGQARQKGIASILCANNVVRDDALKKKLHLAPRTSPVKGNCFNPLCQ